MTRRTLFGAIAGLFIGGAAAARSKPTQGDELLSLFEPSDGARRRRNESIEAALKTAREAHARAIVQAESALHHTANGTPYSATRCWGRDYLAEIHEAYVFPSLNGPT